VAPGVLDALKILKPQTVIRWHRVGFRAYWRWKSRPGGGRPKTPADIRQLIRDMSVANPLWGAPRMHGELLKLGIDVGQTTVAKYMARRRQPPSQGWKTFLRNHADGIASMDLFVVPTISFSAVVWISDPAAFPPRASVAGCDRTPERPLDCPSTDRSLWLATGATIYRSRSGLRLWRCRRPAASSNGDTGSADLATVAMAKRIFGEADRFDPPGLSRPCCCVRRTASALSAQFLSKILQRGSYAPVAAQGRADPASRPDCRSHAGDASSGRTAPPIFQSVSFRQGQR
jgi:hypothetical protein